MGASLNEMPALAAWVETATAEIDASTSRAFAVQLCLEELVVNVILHAVPLAADPLSIGIFIRPKGANLQVVVEDNGAPFDPTRTATQDPAPDLEAATIGGRGLMLVRQFAQALTYSRIGDRNRTMLDFTD
jgi:anti-sigma regulatory factor (Ser/Thr protein kinase)